MRRYHTLVSDLDKWCWSHSTLQTCDDPVMDELKSSVSLHRADQAIRMLIMLNTKTCVLQKVFS